ncbi:MAG: DNA-processing protein DprA [Phascolarctobacterium sp.]|nr:DNA-processing protein DprA [Phascolarctobacterium sp.]
METESQIVNDIYYLAALCATEGLGKSKIPSALGLLKSARALYEAGEATLKATELFTAKQISAFIVARDKELPDKIKRFCDMKGVELVTFYAEDYPEPLKKIADPPLVLYVWGKLPKYSYGVAVVGSRECSSYGKKVAGDFSAYLANAGVPIISGGARGIDTAAHEACLEAGGTTIAVLGCGIDIAYPPQNESLFKQIAEHGAVITEFAPGVKPLARNFPQRNRIVVGLAQAVLVAEAKRKSGALITAHIAADEGREVYAVPGEVFSDKSLGCHDLIRKGAILVDSPKEILRDAEEWHQRMKAYGKLQSIFDYELTEAERLAAEQQQKAAKLEQEAKQEAKRQQLEQARQQKLAGLSVAAQNIYSNLDNKALSFDEIIEISDEDFLTLNMAILDLQVANLIEEDNTHRYHRL